MGEGCAWVTLATNDSYCLGALVLAHSLKRVATTHQLVILVTPQVTPIMKERLSQVFSEVVCVDVLDSGDAAHLALLERPELGITFTKLHCWSLTQYSKCVFLDADTLVLQNCDELFEREELSAAPDVGWPDCFNSGVFVYRPSIETFNALIKFAKEKGSFDGGDQGLLNQFFSTWATGDIKKHLPFLYNVCSTSFYSYLPALKQYGKDMKIVHFIGSLKPWLQNFNWGSRSVQESGHLQAPLQHWWDIFIDHVHPVLDVAMAGVAGALSQLAIGDTQGSPALDEHLRRQGWEAGNIDYMGADAFDNIWAKISETLTSPSTEPSAPEQPAPIPADSTPVQVEAPTVPAQVEVAPKVPTSISEPILPPAEVVPLKQVPSEALSAASTDSWEQVSKGTTLAELAASEVSVVAPASSEEVSSSSIESSTASTASSVSSAPSQAEQEPKATTEEKRDSKLVKAESGDTPAPAPAVSAPPSKPKEKLVCHLKPAFEVDLLLTPESEHEDAATIAQSIIASEEALLSPIITSATPPGSSPIIAAIPQNIRDLSVDTAIPETPPVPGLVSLAQIGIISSKSSQEQPQTTTPEDIVIKETETVVAEPKKIKIVKKKSVDGASSVKKTAPEPKTPEDTVPNAKKALPETKSQVEIKSKAPKTPDAELEEHKLVCSIVTKEDPAKVIAQIVLPDDLEKIKPVKKTTKTPAKKTESSEVSPKAAEVDITSAPEESISLQIKLKSAPAKKVAGDAPKVDLPVIEDIVAKGDVSEKKEEPSTPTEEVVPKPKVKKMVKKVPATPKVKSEGVPDSEASKGADAPVPPPRKKVVVVKPKEKI